MSLPDPAAFLRGVDTDPIAVVCPRCGAEVQERFPGPCGTCREQLRVVQRRDAGDVEVADYEPKMNVVPNQIASKE